MALPRRQGRLLDAIDHLVTGADPRLAQLFGAFGRLRAGEPLTAREQLPARASRFWSALWEALAAGGWAAPTLTDLPMTEAACRPGAGSASMPTVPDRARQEPDGPTPSDQADHWHTR
jgi:hypothetical protein